MLKKMFANIVDVIFFVDIALLFSEHLSVMMTTKLDVSFGPGKWSQTSVATN